MRGFKGELLHVLNKNENAVHKSNYFDKLVHRDNIVVLGDSLGDLHMAEGAAECASILTIGFLNDKVQISSCKISFLPSMMVVLSTGPWLILSFYFLKS